MPFDFSRPEGEKVTFLWRLSANIRFVPRLTWLMPLEHRTRPPFLDIGFRCSRRRAILTSEYHMDCVDKPVGARETKQYNPFLIIRHSRQSSTVSHRIYRLARRSIRRFDGVDVRPRDAYSMLANTYNNRNQIIQSFFFISSDQLFACSGSLVFCNIWAIRQNTWLFVGWMMVYLCRRSFTRWYWFDFINVSTRRSTMNSFSRASERHTNHSLRLWSASTQPASIFNASS